MLQLIREFLSLGIIIGAFPNTIVNGQAVDAVPVMTDLNWIASQVNANAATASSVTTLQNTVSSWGPLTAWTPVLSFGGSSAGITYNAGATAGVYLTISSLLIFYFTMVLTNKGGAVGTANIGGLPLNANAALNANSPCGAANANQLTFADKFITLAPVPGNPRLAITSTPGGGGAGPNFLSDAAFVNTSSIFGFGLYPS